MATESSQPPDVLVIGGGVIGLSIAWRSAQRGLAVTVIDPAPGSGASRVAAGMLAPVTEVHYGEQAQLRLNLRAAAMYPEFVAALEDVTAQRVAYRTCGTLAVALDRDDHAVLDDLRKFQQGLGLEVKSLTGRECRRVEPLLAPSVAGGVLVEGDHQVDPRRLIQALLTAAERTGVRVVRRAVSRVRTDGGAATGADLDDGTVIAAGTVVVAAGSRSGQIGGVPDEWRLPVRPVKGQVLRLRASPSSVSPLSQSVRAIAGGSSVYLVPRADGELVIGATQEERGFDEDVTAGATYELLRDAMSIVPGIAEQSLVETAAGLRPGTPDNSPIVGTMPIAGLVAATGHHRNGILLAPVTAEAVAGLLAGEATPELVAQFSPQRFFEQETG